MSSRLVEAWKKAADSYRREIWQPSRLKDRSVRAWPFAFLRVVSITWTVFFESKAASRAAALSFSSLLGLGPVIAIAVLIGGFMLGNNSDPNLVANKMTDIIKSIAPQLNQLEAMNQEDQAAPGAAATPGAVAAPAATVDPKLVDVINGIIVAARSGSAGALGALSLVLIVLLLFNSVENAFNDIWGVRAGRSWLRRVVLYWTILTVGAVLFFGAVALLGAGAFVTVFAKLPFGGKVVSLLRWSLPAASLSLIVGVLTIAYRSIPNTRVLWKGAFCGALAVAALLMLNNFVAFLYLRRVYLERSLYGSLGILPVLMLGLYIFWLYVLIGAAISYAVQNVHFRNSQAAWVKLSESMRERLSLVVLLTICRRFQACLPPVSALELSTMMKVPTQILNESLNRLVDIKLVSAVPPPGDAESGSDNLYQPARPLGSLNLFEFKTLDENLGDDPTGDTLERLDPLLLSYNKAIKRMGDDAFFRKSIEELFAEHPFDESRPPFQTLAAR